MVYMVDIISKNMPFLQLAAKAKKQTSLLYGRCGFVNKKTSRALIGREVFRSEILV